MVFFVKQLDNKIHEDIAPKRDDNKKHGTPVFLGLTRVVSFVIGWILFRFESIEGFLMMYEGNIPK